MNNRPVVLLVDDEPLNLEYLEQELEDEPIQVVTAASGQEALRLVTAQPPDMVFLDIMMPGMDGFEVLRQLKAEKAWSAIPVVIVSAASDMHSIARGIELGAEDYLPKPFDPVILHARLHAGLERKRLRDIEQRYLRALERELEIGREIQSGFLPASLPQLPGWEIEAFFRPAREVAGDFYDLFLLDAGHMVIMLGDVTDKGVGSALFMALYRSLLRVLISLEAPACADSQPSERSPEQRLRSAADQVNQYIISVHQSSMLATAFLAVLDLDKGGLCYLNAGHDHPYLVRSGRIHAHLAPTGPLLGVIEGLDYATQSTTLQPGDTLVVYSDGITDAQDPDGRMFSQERWQDLLNQSTPLDRLHANALTRGVLDFTAGATQYDDISLLVIRRL